MEVLNEERVKKEPICDDGQSVSEVTNQRNKITRRSNDERTIKHEKHSIKISDSKRTRDDISSDDEYPRNRKRQ